jgi:hypothetical protein
LSEDCLEMAYEFKAFTRSRNIKTPQELLQLVMLYCGLDLSLRSAAGDFTLRHQRLSDTAVRRRLMACGPWLKAMLRRMMPGFDVATEGGRLLVLDSTPLTGTAPDGTAYRVHLVLDLATLTLHEAHVTGSDQGESLERSPFLAGDIVIADRGYNHPGSILKLDERRVRVIIRLNPIAMPLFKRTEGQVEFAPSEARLDVAAHLRGSAGEVVSLPVWLRSGPQVGRGWLHAHRLPPDVAEAARRRCRQNAPRKGRTPSADTLYLAGWVIVFTSVPPDELAAETVLALYRTRWQVELMFKRLKSVLDLDALRTRPKSVLGEVWVHGKLLYALVIEKCLNGALGLDWRRMDRPREATPWRFLKLIRERVDAWIHEAHRWKPEHWPAGFKVVKERPRRRKLQTLPAQVVRLMAAYQASGIAHQTA